MYVHTRVYIYIYIYIYKYMLFPDKFLKTLLRSAGMATFWASVAEEASQQTFLRSAELATSWASLAEATLTWGCRDGPGGATLKNPLLDPCGWAPSAAGRVPAG